LLLLEATALDCPMQTSTEALDTNNRFIKSLSLCVVSVVAQQWMGDV
jgi:hypothetical protein